MLKLAGAVYLIFLGAQALLGALRPRDAATVVSARSAAGMLPAMRAFKQGLFSDLSNPKMAVFFNSLLPQFAPVDGGAFSILCGLGLVFCGLTFLWLSVYAVAVARAADFLRRTHIRRVLEGLTGAVMILFGLRLATERG